ncbi:PIG-L family deacetylase, partial [Pseudomonas sp. CAN2814]|uniref:PIG-L deacetylase family protein n=1 Tax=Pseudomonas sp. CAN1 TaxID=3046726 RepID=UPI0026499666
MSEAANLIAGSTGTPASAWRGCVQLERLPRIRRSELLPPGRRLVVVAPHPDDEVLACGGLLASLDQGLEQDREGLLISVTDGEGSHPDSPRWTPESLRRARQEESRTALAELGLDVPQWQWQRLHLPDSGVQAATLAQALGDWIRPGDR